MKHSKGALGLGQPVQVHSEIRLHAIKLPLISILALATIVFIGCTPRIRPTWIEVAELAESSIRKASCLLGCRPTVTVTTSVANILPFPITPSTPEGDPDYEPPSFPILGFEKHAGNPIIKPNAFHDWESAYTYNPTAIVLNETIFLLYRASDHLNVSTIGLAWSTDGLNFTRLDTPVMQPSVAEDKHGTEDPRIVRVNGTFYLTYTAYNGTFQRLGIATSTDLLSWDKRGYPFPHANNRKAGVINNERAADGLYHMYVLNTTNIFGATSTDLIHWNLTTRKPFEPLGRDWNALVVEPGATPVRTRDGRWLHVYNGKANGKNGYTYGQYSAGQMLIDPTDKKGPVKRLDRPFLVPQTAEELYGRVNNVVFAEALVQFKGKWFLYYGQADRTIGVAIADCQPRGSSDSTIDPASH